MAAVDGVTAAVLHAQQLGDALVELVVADAVKSRPITLSASMEGSSWKSADRNGVAPMRSPADDEERCTCASRAKLRQTWSPGTRPPPAGSAQHRFLRCVRRSPSEAPDRSVVVVETRGAVSLYELRLVDRHVPTRSAALGRNCGEGEYHRRTESMRPRPACRESRCHCVSPHPIDGADATALPARSADRKRHSVTTWPPPSRRRRRRPRRARDRAGTRRPSPPARGRAPS